MSEQPAPIDWMTDDLAELNQLGLFRRRRIITQRAAGRITIDGVEYVDFASNDYLGLATHPQVIQAAKEAADRWGWGSGASSLITGYTQAHADLEHKIARFEGTEAALVFPSGFAANLGALSALAGPGDLILSEKRNHASLIDGCRLSKATVRIFDGTQPETISSLLADAGRFPRRLIVTDSVFSMDGDIAPLRELADIADKFEALLYVDEAHATGVLGPMAGAPARARHRASRPASNGYAQQGGWECGGIHCRSARTDRLAGQPCPALHLFNEHAGRRRRRQRSGSRNHPSPSRMAFITSIHGKPAERSLLRARLEHRLLTNSDSTDHHRRAGPHPQSRADARFARILVSRDPSPDRSCWYLPAPRQPLSEP